MNKPSLTLVRRMKASPDTIYGAWTDAAQIMKWFGPAEAQMLTAEVDARVGGAFRMTFRTPDGEAHDVSGVYREAAPGRKLVFTWMWRTLPDRPSLVTIDLRPEADGAEMTLTHEQFFDEAARDRHLGGWSGTMIRLGEHVAHRQAQTKSARAVV